MPQVEPATHLCINLGVRSASYRHWWTRSSRLLTLFCPIARRYGQTGPYANTPGYDVIMYVEQSLLPSYHPLTESDVLTARRKRV